jgi:hypothetical protein
MSKLAGIFIVHSSRRATWDMIVEYMEKFVKWGNAEYGANAKLDNWFLFPGQCEPISFRERQIREWKARPDHEKLMREDPSGYRRIFTTLERELDSLKLTRRPKK